VPQAGGVVLEALQSIRLQFVHLFVSFHSFGVLALFEEAAGDLPLYPAGLALPFCQSLFELIMRFFAVETGEESVRLAE
jgi:hypothetical protein